MELDHLLEVVVKRFPLKADLVPSPSKPRRTAVVQEQRRRHSAVGSDRFTMLPTEEQLSRRQRAQAMARAPGVRGGQKFARRDTPLPPGQREQNVQARCRGLRKEAKHAAADRLSAQSRDTVHPQRVRVLAAGAGGWGEGAAGALATGAAATGAAAAGVAAAAAALADETVFEAETQEHVSPRLQGRTLSGGIGGTPTAGLSPSPSARRKRGASQPTEAAAVFHSNRAGRRVRRAKSDLIRMETRPGWAAGPQGQAAAARAKAELEEASEEGAIDFDDPHVRELLESPATQEDSDPEATQPMDDGYSPGPPYRFGPSSMLQAATEFDFTRDPI